ncbi:uncharacterized protein Smp_200730 [Schistosoma mansoni]|uniref:uncharacterized protein n=1 Tax=Schistosoma mansoni TaxID=6183 RepID=UPI00022DC87E|nr:uncharacterized protein Smp_200730 [Schistosoma mansoni]|eukprot:XP_018648067.1 uncharacterized protein Smp_200730 [Schistosoma mansoni]
MKMINLHRYFLLTINYLFYVWIICIHVNCFVQSINEQSLIEQNYSQNNNNNNNNNPIGCIDSDGIWRGLFSTWMENPTCWCTCQPVSRMAVSVCDGCEINKSINNNNLNINSNYENNKNLLNNESIIEIFNSFDTIKKTNNNEINQKRSVDNHYDHKISLKNSNCKFYK